MWFSLFLGTLDDAFSNDESDATKGSVFVSCINQALLKEGGVGRGETILKYQRLFTA